MDNPRVGILIATYQRPDALSRLLASIECLQTSYNVVVVVVENERSGPGLPIARKIASKSRFAYRFGEEPAPGIAEARNRALQLGNDLDIVCFVDDDETVESHWLDRLIEPIVKETVSCVSGPVISEFENPLPAWAKAGFFDEMPVPSGELLAQAATNNLAFSRKALEAYVPEHFDPRFSQSGGSDILLTSVFVRRGGTIIRVSDALVHERVPLERCRAKWILRRAVRGGGTHARVQVWLPSPDLGGPGSPTRRIYVAAQGIMRILSFPFLLVSNSMVFGPVSGFGRALRVLMRGLGFVGVSGGHYVREYRR